MERLFRTVLRGPKLSPLPVLPFLPPCGSQKPPASSGPGCRKLQSRWSTITREGAPASRDAELRLRRCA